MLDEALWLLFPLFEILKWQILLEQKLNQLSSSILATLLLFVFRVGVRHVEDLPVLLRRLGQLRLEILELHGRDQEPDPSVAVLIRALVLVPLIVDGRRNYLIHRENDQLLYL